MTQASWSKSEEIGGEKKKKTNMSLVNIGLKEEMEIDQQKGMRCHGE